MKLIKKVFQLVLIPLILAGAFFVWSTPRITTDSNFNGDEFNYLVKSEYFYALMRGDLTSPIWNEWFAYDQPHLGDFIYAQVPGSRSTLDGKNFPCVIPPDSYEAPWSCIGATPLNKWPSITTPARDLLIKARTLATAISAVAVATTYLLGMVIAGPIVGLIAAILFGWFTFFKGLSTMVMLDQILIVLLNLAAIATILLIRARRQTTSSYVLLGIISGLAIATKPNAALLLAPLFFFLWINKFTKSFVSTTYKLIMSALIATLVFFVFNPQLWRNPIAGVQKMVEIRLEQISNQRSTIADTATQNINDTLSYSANTIFRGPSYNPSPKILPILLIGIIGLIGLLFHEPLLALIITTSVAFLEFTLPLKWDRYILPVMPFIACTISYGTSLIFSIRIRHLKKIFLTLLASLLIYPFIFFTKFMTTSEIFISALSFILAAQGTIVTIAMLYGFTHNKAKLSETNLNQGKKHTFSLILPVRNESRVISATIKAFDKIRYPETLYEVLIPVRADDYETIQEINKTLESVNHQVFRVIPIDGAAETKPYSLNIGLHYATGEIVGVFDAEDEPHPDLLTQINTKFNEGNLAAVQAPVQLVNLNSAWYSTLYSLEYYFWFQSVLPFLSKSGITPLGGNTIFLKTNVLKELNGWDESSLTEDADLGVRLSKNGYSVGIITNPTLATLEETPLSEIGVVKQRSRWDQGYLQVLKKGDWKSLPLKQKLLAIYILTQPIFRHLAFLNMFIAPVVGVFLHVSTFVALISFLPTYFLLMQWGMYLIGLHDLSTLYKIKLSPFRYISTILFFYPYQALLSLATFRALAKTVMGNNTWEKTAHYNAHRQALAVDR